MPTINNPDGSMFVIVPFKPEVAQLWRATAAKNNLSSVDLLYDAARTFVCCDLANTAKEDREFERIFTENTPAEDQFPAPTLELEPQIEKLLARYIKLRPQDERCDVINGALIDTLDTMVHELEKEPEVGFHPVKDAARRRLRRSRQAGLNRRHKPNSKDVALLSAPAVDGEQKGGN